MSGEAWIMLGACVPLVVVEAKRWRERSRDRKEFDERMAKMKVESDAWWAARNGKDSE